MEHDAAPSGEFVVPQFFWVAKWVKLDFTSKICSTTYVENFNEKVGNQKAVNLHIVLHMHMICN